MKLYCAPKASRFQLNRQVMAQNLMAASEVASNDLDTVSRQALSVGPNAARENALNDYEYLLGGLCLFK